MKLLGFNAVRMPYSMQNLFGLAPKNFTWAQCTNTNKAALLANTQDPSKPAGNGKRLFISRLQRDELHANLCRAPRVDVQFVGAKHSDEVLDRSWMRHVQLDCMPARAAEPFAAASPRVQGLVYNEQAA